MLTDESVDGLLPDGIALDAHFCAFDTHLLEGWCEKCVVNIITSHILEWLLDAVLSQLMSMHCWE